MTRATTRRAWPPASCEARAVSRESRALGTGRALFSEYSPNAAEAGSISDVGMIPLARGGGSVGVGAGDESAAGVPLELEPLADSGSCSSGQGKPTEPFGLYALLKAPAVVCQPMGMAAACEAAAAKEAQAASM
jgi:hypothetical protein